VIKCGELEYLLFMMQITMGQYYKHMLLKNVSWNYVLMTKLKLLIRTN